MRRSSGAPPPTTWTWPHSRASSPADMRGTQTGTPYYGIFSPGTVQQTSGSGAGWSDAGVIIPWTSWLQTGDTSVIDQNWAAMEKYLNAIDAANPDGLWKNEAGHSLSATGSRPKARPTTR